MPPFNHHDDQAEWGPLVLELIDNGVDMSIACQEAMTALPERLTYAAEWDTTIAEMYR
jgi:hypothetical protein